jgi:hypothetical protein
MPSPIPLVLARFCRGLSFRLASVRHRLLVESDSEHTADWLVVSGLLKADRPRQIEVTVYHRHLSGPRPFAAEASHERDLFEYERLPDGLLGPAHLRMLRDADVAIVIGGGRNSYPAGLAAAFMGVRLIPIAEFGGAGGRLWAELRDEFEKPLVKLPAEDTWRRLSGDPDSVLRAVLDEVASLPRLMVVHGRSADRNRLVEILEAHGVSAPVVLQEQLVTGSTVPEKFEHEARSGGCYDSAVYS